VQGLYIAFGQLFWTSCTAPLNTDVITEQPSVPIPIQFLRLSDISFNSDTTIFPSTFPEKIKVN